MADDTGGLPSGISASEPLRAVAEVDPLIDVEEASSVDLRVGPSGLDAQRGSDEAGSQFDIVTVPEQIVGPDVGGPRSASGWPACAEHWGA